MSDTYTGTLDPSPGYTLQIGQLFPDNDDRQGSLVEIDALPSGALVDNIFYFNGTTSGQYFRRVIDGPIRAAYCGIFPGAADSTAALNNALAHPDIWEIVFDHSYSKFHNYPNFIDITINGAVTVPAGKALTFRAGNRIVGTGSITGGIIDAPDNHECFISTFNVTPAGSAKNYYSAKWFGVKGDNLTPDAAAIQKVFNFIAHHQANAKPVYFPRGIYLIEDSIIGHYWNGSQYQYWTGTFFGEFDARSGLEPPLTVFKSHGAAMNSNFILGIQQARSVIVKNIRFSGNYTRPSEIAGSQLSTVENVYRYTKIQWLQSGIRDTPHSPNCCVNIDPFCTTKPTLPNPEDPNDPIPDWYPNHESWYRNAPGASSAVILSCCWFASTPVGFACSINGQLLNAEQITLEHCSFNIHKAAYACGQNQSKENLLNDARCWSVIRTIIECSEYGDGGGNPPFINGMNVGGAVYSLIYGAAPFPFSGRNIFAEGISKLGAYESPAATASLTECTFSFAGGSGGFPTPDYICRGNWVLENCVSRYYDNGLDRLKLAAWASNVQVIGGTISLVPIISFSTADADVRNPNIIGAKLYGIGNSLPYNTLMHEATFTWTTLNNSVLPNRFSFEFGFGSEGGRYRVYYNQSSPDAFVFLQNAVVTVDSDDTWLAALVLSSGSIQKINVGDYLFTDMSAGYTYLDEGTPDRFPILGRVVEIDGTTVTVSGIGANIPVGTTASIPIYVNWIRTVNLPLVCNMTNASNVLTNVDVYLNTWPPVGTRLEHPYIPAGVYVTAVDTTARTITLSANCTGSENDVTIINGRPEIQADINYDLSVAASYPLFEGAIFTTNRDTNYSKRGEASIIRRTIMSGSSTRTKWIEPLGNGFRRIDVARLRFQGASPDTTFYLIDNGREGLFKYDASDTTTVDNGATVIKGSGTVRFRRIIDNNFYNARWFGKSTIYFDTTTDANTLVGSAYRYTGLKVLIVNKEYSWKYGTADADLIPILSNEVENFTSGSDTSKTVAANYVIAYILVNPSSNLSAFEVGTSSGADDVVANQAVNTGGWTVFHPNKYFASSGSLFFGGISASTDIKIVKIPLS